MTAVSVSFSVIARASNASDEYALPCPSCHFSRFSTAGICSCKSIFPSCTEIVDVCVSTTKVTSWLGSSD